MLALPALVVVMLLLSAGLPGCDDSPTNARPKERSRQASEKQRAEALVRRVKGPAPVQSASCRLRAGTTHQWDCSLVFASGERAHCGLTLASERGHSFSLCAGSRARTE